MNNLNTKYPGKVETPDANYPTGGFKNETTPGLFDGTPFEKGWADDLNAFMQGLIKAAGITISGTTDTVLVSQMLEGLLYQIQTADYFIESGAADAYILDPLANNYDPVAYKDGQRIRFIPDNTNTGASTVDVSSLGAKAIKLQGAALAAADLVAGETYELRYDLALGWFEIVSTSEVAAGTDIRDVSRGLVIIPNSGTPLAQLDIDADEVILQNSTGASRRFTSINLTAAITSSGANGLDTGSEAANTWYHAWVIAKTDGTVAALLSTSPTVPTMPGGYTFKARVGAVRNDSGSNFLPFRQEEGKVDYDAVELIKDGTFAVDTWTALSVTNFFPPTAKKINTSIGGGGKSGLSPRSDGHAGSYERSAVTGSAASTFGGVFPTARSNFVGHKIRYEDSVYYYTGSAGMTMVAVGWEY